MLWMILSTLMKVCFLFRNYDTSFKSQLRHLKLCIYIVFLIIWAQCSEAWPGAQVCATYQLPVDRVWELSCRQRCKSLKICRAQHMPSCTQVLTVRWLLRGQICSAPQASGSGLAPLRIPRTQGAVFPQFVYWLVAATARSACSRERPRRAGPDQRHPRRNAGRLSRHRPLAARPRLASCC